jgi:hypothetical protein
MSFWKLVLISRKLFLAVTAILLSSKPELQAGLSVRRPSMLGQLPALSQSCVGWIWVRDAAQCRVCGPGNTPHLQTRQTPIPP